ncbi:hypothetical protein VR46_42085, partial [Streptomyces sp. NRRL S-444]
MRYGWGRRAVMAGVAAAAGTGALLRLAPGGGLGTSDPVQVTGGASATGYRALARGAADGPSWAGPVLEAASEGTLVVLGLLL